MYAHKLCLRWTFWQTGYGISVRETSKHRWSKILSKFSRTPNWFLLNLSVWSAHHLSNCLQLPDRAHRPRVCSSANSSHHKGLISSLGDSSRARVSNEEWNMSEHRSPCSKPASVREFLGHLYSAWGVKCKGFWKRVYFQQWATRFLWIWKDALGKMWRGRTKHSSRLGARFWFCLPLPTRA